MTAVATHRGTTNGNVRGNNAARRRRRRWLVETYRADVDGLVVTWPDGRKTLPTAVDRSFGVSYDRLLFEQEQLGAESAAIVPACRCYRCGVLCTEDTVTVDRIVPGCEGGTYDKSNIRPACGTCNSETGGRLGNARKAALKEVRS